MADQTQPWAEQTVEVPDQGRFRKGRAQVGAPTPRTEPFPTVPHDATGTGWPGAAEESRPVPPGYHWRQLRSGRHWSMTGALFAFVCWGVWAISAGGDLTSPVVTFVLTLFVAVGLFALSRLVGRIVYERQLGRVRRSARGAHLVTGLFLAGVGVAYLRQTEWVVNLWNWVAGL
ncbi:hypothetical protein [Plantactinospora sp. CA-290183]|uniref:hypothetical protein n=1 Tax=Plantactinospora sp. CA-290183 TaxID=3240006 RepID=UPI003D8E2B89